MIFWELTDRCNLSCVHCRGGDHIAPAVEEELSTVEARALVDSVAERYKPVIVLTGGEPLYREDVYNIAEHIRSRGLRAALATNGTMVDAPAARRIADAGIARVSISIDGAGPDSHDTFRGVSGAFAGALSGARALREAGVEFQFNMTVTRRNVNEMDAVFRLAEEEGARGLHLFMLVPVGCGVELAETDMLSADEYENVLEKYWHMSRAVSLETKATCAPHYARISAVNFRRERQDAGGGPGAASPDPAHPGAGKVRSGHPGGAGSRPPSLGCLAGTAVCFVSHRGEVRPCGYFPVEAGNVRTTPFPEIWENSRLFRDLRNPAGLKGKCGICEYRVLCGGCRARAYQATGDYMAEEPFCRHAPRRAGA